LYKLALFYKSQKYNKCQKDEMIINVNKSD
jgi:hypothetical protein